MERSEPGATDVIPGVPDATPTPPGDTTGVWEKAAATPPSRIAITENGCRTPFILRLYRLRGLRSNVSVHFTCATGYNFVQCNTLACFGDALSMLQAHIAGG